MAHKSNEEVIKALQEAEKSIVINGTYSHYKKPENHYKILSLGVQEATDKICVIYEALYFPGVTFVRDLDNWLEKPFVAGKAVARFKRINP